MELLMRLLGLLPMLITSVNTAEKVFGATPGSGPSKLSHAMDTINSGLGYVEEMQAPIKQLIGGVVAVANVTGLFKTSGIVQAAADFSKSPNVDLNGDGTVSAFPKSAD